MAKWRHSAARMWSVCVAVCVLGMVSAVSPKSEEFTEELVLRPLPDGKVLGYFLFVNQLGAGKVEEHHHKLFPKAIYQLVQKFRIREMELSFTQGRWDHQRWGGLDSIASAKAKPEGVELWAQFHNPNREVDALWRNLTHALSGLFCASINFLESPSMVSKRGWVPRAGRSAIDDEAMAKEESLSAVRHGALPREAVCTENLTPWLKLLPCRDRAGLSTLLERPRIYNGNYDSLRVHVRAGDVDRHGQPQGSITLHQSLTLVLKPSNVDAKAGLQGLVRAGLLQQRQPDWSLSSLFGKQLLGKCPLASSSDVHLELESNLVEELQVSKDRSQSIIQVNADVVKNDVFALSVAPESVLQQTCGPAITPSLLLHYDVQKHSKALPLNVGMLWRAPVVWSPCQGPFRVTQFLTGGGDGRGSIVSLVNANRDGHRGGGSRSSDEHSQRRRLAGDDNSLAAIDVTTFQMVPWYVRLYMHTLKVVVDGRHVGLHDGTVNLKLSPSDDRKSPAVLEIGLSIPCNTSMLFLSVEFDKGFLRIDEHPPDANRGFDLPSALFTFSSAPTSSRKHSALRRRALQFDSDSAVQIYPENLLVPLATPDFSMPYNVITFTMTALALYFGSLLNALRLRSAAHGDKQPPLAAGSSSKLSKILAILTARKKQKAL